MKNNDKHIFISVYLHGKGFTPAGVITFNEEIGYAGFSYFPAYMENDYPPLNPATLNWRDGYKRHFIVDHANNNQMLDRTFWEMLPNKNDWGTHVLISRFPEYAQMNNAQKLYFLGNRIVGGLSSYIKEKPEEESINTIDWLDKVRDESILFYMKDIEKISYVKAINPMSSYGGLRPKCMFEDDEGQHWIAKFNLPTDHYDMAIGEHIAMEMSRDMGLTTAESKILTLPSGENVFLSKRFDRDGESRFHTLSFFALSPGSEVIKRNAFAQGHPGSFIQSLVRRYSDFENMDTVNIIMKMLLDIGVNNTDNHLRNIRMILNRKNKWELSPIYDVVFNPYNLNHTYNPAGLALKDIYIENPYLAEAMSNELGVDEQTIGECIEKAKDVLYRWEEYCEKHGMKGEDKDKIGQAVYLGLYRNQKEYTSTSVLEVKPEKVYPKPKPKNV